MGILKKILFSIFLIANVEARPISYSGGSTMMAMSDDMKEIHLLPLFTNLQILSWHRVGEMINFLTRITST